MPLVVAVGLLLRVAAGRAARINLRDAARKHGVLVEAINGLETIKSVGAESRAQSAWEVQVAASARSAGITRFWSAFATHFTSLTANLVTVGVIVVGVYQIGAGQLTMGALIACSILSGRAMAPLAQVASVLNRYHQARRPTPA